MKPVKRDAVYADLVALPEILVAEILDGDLFASPRPASPHAHATTHLGSNLVHAFDNEGGGPALQPGGWRILFEPEMHLGRDVLVPDLAGWRRERMPRVPNVAYFELPPDWVCEVVSPTTASIDRVRKSRIYARHGVGHMWIVDPLVRTVEVFRLEGGYWSMIATHEGNEILRAEPFDAVELAAQRWWCTE